MFRNIFFVSKKNHNISPKNFNSISHSSLELISDSDKINEKQQTQKESTNNNEEKSIIFLKKVENKQIKNKPKSKELSFPRERQELVAKLLTKGEKTYKNKKLSALEKQKKFIS
ncbi:hypothetical protein C6B37_00780 [Candidatus Phytoplasma phoenicium]|uniref:Uncharacterized protein n=1 Tax=Candidatus Phytoplasma phoenicium TaxID=198422 RepID=A0A2S8NV99_9MOLU|nr:hypothetical protein C6B37_00780 [Candidatus Phytoplasma phoenicium]